MAELRDFPDQAFSGVHHGPLQAGEWITLQDSKGRRHSVFLERGKIFHTTKGGIAHDDLIDGPDAVVIKSKGGVDYLALRPLMADYSVSMPRGAAVIYPKDTAQIVTMADIFPGAKVVEAGAGSGALTTALLRAVGIHGQVISFERREDFAEVADVIALALQPEPDVAALRARTEALAARHPLYPHLSGTSGDAR